MIRIVVVGAAGRMGQEVIRAVREVEDIRVVGAVDVQKVGEDPIRLAAGHKSDLKINNSLDAVLKETLPDVMVDFTTPQAVAENVRTGLKRGVHMVIGTTGLTVDEREEIDRQAREAGVGAFIAPNFALGAVLMMEFARKAAKYFPHAEIIELHHDRKMDAPSGTSLLTAEKMNEGRKKIEKPESIEILSGCRGGDAEGIPIHSVRLPGMVAHQEVIFGGEGQILTIRHDSLDRSSFMPGVMLAIRKVVTWQGLVWGLENLLE